MIAKRREERSRTDELPPGVLEIVEVVIDELK